MTRTVCVPDHRDGAPPRKTAKTGDRQREEELVRAVLRTCGDDSESLVRGVLALVDVVADAGVEVLCHTALCGFLDAVEVLISAGIAVNPPRGSRRRGRGHPACYTSDPAVLELLLVVGARPECWPNEPCVVRIPDPGYAAEIAQLLLCHGGDLSLAGRPYLFVSHPGEAGVPPSQEVLETLCQAGGSEYVAQAFWYDLKDNDFAQLALTIVAVLDGVIDAKTREVCHREFGVWFGNLRDLVGFLNQPSLDVVMPRKAAEHLWPLSKLASDPRHRALVEFLLINSSSESCAMSNGMGAITSACWARDDDCEMVQLLLCSQSCLVGMNRPARSLAQSVIYTRTLGPAKLLLTCGLASACLEWSTLCPDFLLSILMSANSPDLLDELLDVVKMPDELLCWAIATCMSDGDDEDEALEFLVDNCEDLSWIPPRSLNQRAKAPTLSARTITEDASGHLRLLAQCGVDLLPLLSDPHDDGTWQEVVRHNMGPHLNDTSTLFWH